MSSRTPHATDPGVSVRSLYEARASAELAHADSVCPGADAVASSGALLPGVVLVKGLPGPGEAAGQPVLTGSEGEAAYKALEALGWDESEIACVIARPDPALDPDCCSERLRVAVEALDPRVVVALDSEAAHVLAAAFGAAPLDPGSATVAAGRRLVWVGEFERSLRDEGLKRTVWQCFQAARPDGPVY